MSRRSPARIAAGFALIVAAIAGSTAAPWAGAEPPAAPKVAAPKPEVAKPEPALVREAPRALPSGTFVKEFDVEPYASGSLTWTYDGDRVGGVIEVSAPIVGGEVELETDSELSVSSHGVIYGVINAVRLNRLRLPPDLAAEFKVGPGAYSVIEPLVNDALVDVPFSYQCRAQGERITISNYRILLSGPNPLGKLGGLALGGEGAILAYFQAVGTAIEGTYTRADGKPAPKRKPMRAARR